MPPHGGGAEIIVKPQGLHSLGNRTEITPRLCRSWSHISTGFVNSAPAGDPSNGCYRCWDGSGLSSVSFMGTCMWGLGSARVRAAGSSHSESGAWILQSWSLTSVGLCWWPYENNAWGTPGLIAIVPTVEAGSRAKPTTAYFVSPHNRWHGRAHSLLDNSRGGLLSGYSPSGTVPVPPVSHHSSAIDLGAAPPTLGEQIPSLTGLWKLESKEEASGKTHCRLWPSHLLSWA